ncbi:MAG: RibD family protein [Fimbriimonadaceae bacterium]|nr:RibD family protein [Fimbriimonadaceae bacterium]
MADLPNLYEGLEFPPAPPERPYVFMNMVTTIDGKIVTGSREDSVEDLGTDMDHRMMRVIEHAADAVMIGAATLRANSKMSYAKHLYRIVVTRSMDIDLNCRFFTEAPEKSIIICPPSTIVPAEKGISVVRLEDPKDWHASLRTLRNEFKIEKLLCEGGSELNAQLLRLDLADELFLTLAPKIKLGRDLPNYAGGEPLPRSELLNFEIQSVQQFENEVFIRYRRPR